MDHARALGDTAHAAGLTAYGEFQGDLLDLGVGGHDTVGGIQRAVLGKPCHQGGDAVCNGGDIQGLTDDTGGGYHHVCGGDVQSLAQQVGHLLGDLDAVCVAGVGVAAVADHGLGVAVGDVVLGDGQGRALDAVGGVDAGGGGLHVGVDDRQVMLGLVLADAAMDAVGGKALRGTDTAGDTGDGRHDFLLYLKRIIIQQDWW